MDEQQKETRAPGIHFRRCVSCPYCKELITFTNTFQIRADIVLGEAIDLSQQGYHTDAGPMTIEPQQASSSYLPAGFCQSPPQPWSPPNQGWPMPVASPVPSPVAAPDRYTQIAAAATALVTRSNDAAAPVVIEPKASKETILEWMKRDAEWVAKAPEYSGPGLIRCLGHRRLNNGCEAPLGRKKAANAFCRTCKESLSPRERELRAHTWT